MKINLSALIDFRSKGVDAIGSKVKKLKDTIVEASRSALDFGGGVNPYKDKGLNKRTHREYRGVATTRNASGRDFAGIAAGLNDNDTNNMVAAYAVLAANIFAVTAAFNALSKAAQTEQLAKGLEIVGARAGVVLPTIARDLEQITDYAISYADSMKVVAQATAAGFSSSEIKELAEVARGASVALGRDMSDALDRLTRGTIKLEPELLDELGIMTRLDEAVRAYAVANNKTVSSLTQTERRQAFLNAVLEEGARKFGDVSEQVSANPYDKLSASIRNLGTDVLTFINGFLKPLVALFTEFPALALIPLMGVFKEAGSKILPDFGKSIDKIGQKAASTGLKLASLQQIQSTNIGEFEGLGLDSAQKIANTKIVDQTTAIELFDVNNLKIVEDRKEVIRAIEEEILKLKQKGIQTNQQEIKDLEESKRILIETNQQLLVIQKNEARQAKVAGSLALKESLVNRNKQLQELTLQGDYVGAIKQSFAQLGGDFANLSASTDTLWNKTVRLGNGFKNVGMTVMSGLSAVSLWLVGIGVAIQAGLAIYDKFIKTDAQKQFDKVKKELQELAEGAKNTRLQIDRMFEAGSGQKFKGLDAALTTIIEINKKTEEYLALQKQAQRDTDIQLASAALLFSNPLAGANPFIYKGIFKPSEFGANADDAAINDKVKNKAVRENIKLIETLDKDAYASLLAKIKDRSTTELDIIEAVAEQNKLLETQKGFYKDLQPAIDGFGKTLREMIPKENDSPLSKFVEELKLAENALGKLSDSGGIGSALGDLKSSDLQLFIDISKAYGQEVSDDVIVVAGALRLVEEAQINVNKAQEEFNKNKLDPTAILNLEKFKEALEKITEEFGKIFKLRFGGIVEDATELEAAARALAIAVKLLGEKQKILSLEKSIRDVAKENNKLDRDKLRELSKLGLTLSNNNAVLTLGRDIVDKTAELENIRSENAIKKIELEEEATTRLLDLYKKRDLTKNQEDKDGYIQQIANINTTLGLDKQLLDQREIAAQKQLKYAEQLFQKQFSDTAIKERNLKILEDELSITKQIYDTRVANSLKSIEIEEQRIRNAANVSGTKITPQQEREFQVQKLQAELDSIEEQKKFLDRELEVKTGLLELQKTLLDSEWSLLEAELRAAGKTDQANSVAAEKNKLNSVFDKAISNLNTSNDERKKALDLQRTSIELAIEDLVRGPMERIFSAMRGNVTELKDAFRLTQQLLGVAPGVRDQVSSQINSEGGLTASGATKQDIADMIKLATEIESTKIVMEGLGNASDAFYTGLTEGIKGVISGTTSLKEAFANMALSILDAIAQMIAQMIALKIISSATGLFGSMGGGSVTGPGGSFPTIGQANAGFANGGIIPLAEGGIAARGLQGVVKKPTYLVGEGRYNEAVVPLPNGRSIPVQMHGGAGASNNVQVNVNVASNGNVQTETQGEDMSKLGSMIAAAVQKELVAQKSPGGILNRYGAA